MKKIPRDENYAKHVQELRRKNYLKHREKILAKLKEDREINPDKHKVSSEKYRNKPEIKSKRKEYDKLYRVLHREKRTLSKRNAEIKRLAKDPAFRLRKMLKNSIYVALKRNKSTKNNLSILKHLPYSMEELKQHLESQFESWMNWNNWGIYDPKSWNDNDSSTWTWQIDHIVHHSNFRYTSMDDEAFQKCWSLANLRPLNSKQNILENTPSKR